MEFKDKIKKLRSKLNLTLKEVADKVGVSEATIQRYESGEIKNVRRDKIMALANALQVTPGYLMGWEKRDDEGNLITNETYYSASVYPDKIKVYGKICAGNGELAYEDIIDEIRCPYPKIHGNMLALQVEGESMNKIIPNGAYAVLIKQSIVENGQIAAVIIDNENAMLKRFYQIDDETVVLKPESTEDYQAITYHGRKFINIYIHIYPYIPTYSTIIYS